MNTKCMSISELNEHEPCFIVKDYSSDIYIPKLMPLLTKGSTNINKVNINLKLANDSSCLPSYDKKIKTKSFITANVYHENSDIRLKTKVGNKYMCDLIGKSPTHIYLSNKKM